MKRESIIILNFTFLLLFLNSCEKTKKIYDSCHISESKIFDYEYIIENSIDIINLSSYDCNVQLIDEMLKQYLKNSNNSDALLVLSSIYRISDGELSEYFLEVGNDIFYKSFEKTIKNINNNDDFFEIEKIIIESISMEMSVADDETVIDDFIRNQINKYDFSVREMQYINRLKDKFNKEIFD